MKKIILIVLMMITTSGFAEPRKIELEGYAACSTQEALLLYIRGWENNNIALIKKLEKQGLCAIMQIGQTYSVNVPSRYIAQIEIFDEYNSKSVFVLDEALAPKTIPPKILK